MQKLYTMEKVLYLASLERGLNVDKTEKKHTDLSERVNKLLANKSIVEVADDDVARYYKITDEGRVRLLQLQIQFRKQHGKSTDMHEMELSDLRHKLSAA
ncbi:TPA: hypothetical protein LTW74_001426 [Enterobacter hormaechei]|nr:hypothetical protein [Enterobacter hormaechei]